MALTVPQNYLNPTSAAPVTPAAPKSSLQVTGSWDNNGTFAPAVVTSKAATNDYNDITQKSTAITTGITNQAAKLAADKAAADAAATAKTQTEATAKAAADKAALDKQTADAKTAAVSGTGTTLTATPKVVTLDDGNQYTIDSTGGIAAGSNTGKYKVGTNINDYPNSTYLKTLSTGGSVAQAQIDQDTADQQSLATEKAKQQQILQDTISGYQNGTIPLTAGEQAQVDALKQSWQQLIDTQILTNTSAFGNAASTAYQGGAQYAGAGRENLLATNTIGSIVSAGVYKVADLNIKMAGAIAALTDAMREKDINLAKQKWDVYNGYSEERAALLKDNIATAQAAIKAETDKVQKVKEEQQAQIDKANTAMQDAIKGGADQATIEKMRAAAAKGDVAGVLAAGAVYTQTSSNPDIAKYLQYKKDILAKGLTPEDYGSWQEKQDKSAAALKSSEAYNTAYGTAAGKAAAEAKFGTGDGTTVEPTPGAGGILNETGLSLNAFNFLTQGTGALSRMTAASRAQVQKEANNFLNSKGIDVATFQSQYKAYNEVLQKNIERFNKTGILEGEIKGSVDNFISEVGNQFGNLKPANVAKLIVGEQFNDATVQKYSFNIKNMANDLAGYFAAARGANAPELQDIKDAASVISNGLSAQGAQGFKEAVEDNTKKMSVVLQNSVNNAQKSVWGLFGVGSKFQPTASPDEAKNSVDEFVKANPAQAENIAKLYEVPGATDEDIFQYIQQLTNAAVGATVGQ